MGVDEKRYYPVDETEKQRLRAEMGFTPERKIILNIGELLPNKNQQMAIRMMPELVRDCPNALLLIAGNGPEKEYLERLIQELGMQNHVKLLGYVTNLQDYQHIADVCVSCSKREGLPLNIVEAMMSGTPVAATKNRGHRELIQDGETGFLVDVNDHMALANRVLRYLSNENTAFCCVRKALDMIKSFSFSCVKRELGRIYGVEEEQR